MWRGMEAFEATLQLLRSLSDSQGTNVSVRTGCLHVARGSKQAAAMREAVSSMPPADALRLGMEWYEPAACEAFGNELAETGASNGRIHCSGARCPDGALFCRSSVVVNSSAYLLQLWAYINSRTPAIWMRRRVEHCHALSSAFDLVIVAAGDGCLKVTEARHLPLDLSRGQVIEYPPPSPQPMSGPREPASSSAANGTAVAAPEAGEAEQRSSDLAKLRGLRVALSSDVYILPHLQGELGLETDGCEHAPEGIDVTHSMDGRWSLVRLDCGGTYEAVDAGGPRGGAAGPPQCVPPQCVPPQCVPPQCIPPQCVPPQAGQSCALSYAQSQAREGPAGGSGAAANAPYAEALLRDSLVDLFPPIRSALGRPRRARAGVRAAPPRTVHGSVPLAGRAHTGAPVRNVWLIAGMGSRGLLYHALIAEWLVDAALSGDPSMLPAEVRRGCFGELLVERVARLAEQCKRAEQREQRKLAERDAAHQVSSSRTPSTAVRDDAKCTRGGCAQIQASSSSSS